MATKRQAAVTDGSARVRFVMLEADVTNGNLSEFANTIASALRTASPRVLAPANHASVKDDTNVSEVDAADPNHESEASEVVTGSNGSGARPQKTRKPYVAKVKVIDVDLNSGTMPFEKYATEKSPDQLNAKFLVSAVWFKEFRQLDEITADHVYTCFKKVGWGSVPDMTQPFRDLKKSGRGDYDDGKFKVNHIGVDFVEKMTRSG